MAYPSRTAAPPVPAEPTLEERLAKWRKAGKRIVFTNGVFDLFHPGHLAQLKAARALGDVLIVGLNSDSSVRGLGKGEERPVLPQSARQALLEELRCVDAVAVFNTPTPLELILKVKPNVLVKGADYNEKEVVGREEVESWGGTVEIVPLVAGWSTTELLRRITIAQRARGGRAQGTMREG